ncbi:unnamed protein product [Peronospora effusa]|nr:unnamed protein product [Peronospora effusa]
MLQGSSRSNSPSRRPHCQRSRSPSRDDTLHRSESKKSHQNRRRRRGKRREMGKKKDRIPDNWVDVAKMGTFVGTSRFVPLRVPLDAKYLPQFETKKDEIWTPTDFLATQQDQNLNIKMIIDLTNTFKYYNGKNEFQNSGVKYVKIEIEGFRGPPQARDVARFMKIVDEFIANEPEGAIAKLWKLIKVARPPGLIKHMYIEDLYKQLGKDEEVQLPKLPEWASAKYSRKAGEGKRRA